MTIEQLNQAQRLFFDLKDINYYDQELKRIKETERCDVYDILLLVKEFHDDGLFICVKESAIKVLQNEIERRKEVLSEQIKDL